MILENGGGLIGSEGVFLFVRRAYPRIHKKAVNVRVASCDAWIVSASANSVEISVHFQIAMLLENSPVEKRIGLQPQLSKQPRKVLGLIMRIQPARIRQHPNQRIADGLTLTTQLGFWNIKRASVSADSQDRQHPRAIATYLRPQPSPALNEFFSRKLGCGRGSARYYICDSTPEPQQFAPFKRRQQSIGESGLMKCGPEPVSGASEMTFDRAGIKARIYPAKKHPQIARDYIRHGIVDGRE